MKVNDQILAVNPTVGQELIMAKHIINEFINSCSHSMRGPLKSINGLLSLLKHGIESGNEDPMVYIDMISSSVEKMEGLMVQFEQFLEFSKQNFKLEPINWQKLADSVIDDVKAQTGITGIDISVKIEQQEFFYSDNSGLRLILFHLISNAVFFHDVNKNTKKIEILIKATKNSCSMYVNDNGSGMAEEIKDKIFQLFFRGSERSGGTGVGLFVVQEVLKKIGGSISVNSEPGVGSNFFVWIPNQCAA